MSMSRSVGLSTSLFLFLLALVGLRSWVFVWFPHAHFDSDQAVFGLMAKDLIAGRALPMFMYGQRYLLSVSVWLCAPLFAAFGPSIFTLKLPMLLMNFAVVLMLWRGLRSESLGPWGTTIAILPFALPGVVVSSRLVEHQGGNIEPFVFVLAAYFLRNRPVLLGILFGVGFLNREFSILGMIALLIMDVIEGVLRERAKQRLLSLACCGATVACLRLLAKYSTSYLGKSAQTGRPSLSNIKGFFVQQLPSLIGADPRELHDFNITSSLSAGHSLISYALGAWLLLVIIWPARVQRLRWSELTGFSTYLTLVGFGQAAAFMVLTPDPFDAMLVRYVLLTLLAFSGMVALVWRRPALRPFTVALVAIMSLFNLTDHVKLLHEYLSGPPRHELELLADRLLTRQVRYARADYWTAFDIAWQTQERIILSPRRGQNARMPRYASALSDHANQVFGIATKPCPGGEPVLRWYLCPPRPRTLTRSIDARKSGKLDSR